MDLIRMVDWWLLSELSSLAEQYAWAAVAAGVAAEYLIIIPFISLYALWKRPEPASHHHSNQKAVIMAVMSVFLALAIRSLVTFVVARPRPFIAHPDMFYLQLNVDPVSFPSGHTLVAFAIAFSLWHSKVKKPAFWLLFVAGLIGLGRIVSGVHYPSDVVGGIIIAFLCSAYLHREASSLRRYLPNV